MNNNNDNDNAGWVFIVTFLISYVAIVLTEAVLFFYAFNYLVSPLFSKTAAAVPYISISGCFVIMIVALFVSQITGKAIDVFVYRFNEGD